MGNKKDWKKKAVEGARRTGPNRLLADRAPVKRQKGYRVVSAVFYLPQVEWIDETTKALQRAGNAKANRALVIREAVLRLEAGLAGKSPAEILQDFTEAGAQRAARKRV